MDTKLLMAASSIFMGLMGIALIFMPDEALEALGQVPNGTLSFTLQLAGGLYFGSATTNWMAKTVLIGGIYSKPLSLGNFFHFFISALTLVKTALNSNPYSTCLFILTVIYVIFAVLFGYVSFTHPAKKRAGQFGKPTTS